MDKKEELFSKVPVSRALISLAVPTIISQVITIIYNMADTFFIGKINDPAQVAATAIAMPAYMIINALANLFGIGGSSAISRALGRGDRDRAKKTASFCIWTGAGVGFFYGLLLLVTKRFLFPVLGATPDTWDYLNAYVFWTMGIGSLPSILNPMLAHLIRSEGYSKQAGFGVAMGGILNMLLDPLFIFVFGLEIKGAAIATFISNIIACLYFLILIFRIRNKSVITLDPRDYYAGSKIPSEVLLVGLPSGILSLMATVSNTVINHIIATYATEAIAGMGIAKKISGLAFAIFQGITHGSLPLIAFNYSAKNRKRMLSAIRLMIGYSIGTALLICIMAYIFADSLVLFFIKDALTVAWGTKFTRIICLACPFAAMSFSALTIFQAAGRKIEPLVLSCLRKGALDIPLIVIFNIAFGIEMVAWATPIADCLAALVAICILVSFLRKTRSMNESKQSSET